MRAFDFQAFLSFVLDLVGLVCIVLLAHWKLVTTETVTALFGFVFGGRAAMRGARMIQNASSGGTGAGRSGGMSGPPPGGSGGPPAFGGFVLLLGWVLWRYLVGKGG